jgi:imidazole glycerol-phosphate synthase subunit HisH
MIHIVDYGLGNIQAFINMYKRLGVEAVRARTAEDLQGATRLILPGVGAFDHAMQLLSESGMRDRLSQLVVDDKVPVLGICVGMQILAESSDEGVESGLGWIRGTVRSFRSNDASTSLPMPHMGWNDVVADGAGGSPLFAGSTSDWRFYFLHSYYLECSEQQSIAARAEYGFPFCCAVQADNVFGVQFHPEKSHHWGALLLKNFANL